MLQVRREILGISPIARKTFMDISYGKINLSMNILRYCIYMSLTISADHRNMFFVKLKNDFSTQLDNINNSYTTKALNYFHEGYPRKGSKIGSDAWEFSGSLEMSGESGSSTSQRFLSRPSSAVCTLGGLTSHPFLCFTVIYPRSLGLDPLFLYLSEVSWRAATSYVPTSCCYLMLKVPYEF